MESDEPDQPERDEHRAWDRLAPVLVFFLVWGLLASFYARHPLLYDTDSYYHLAIGRLFAEHGPVGDLPWVRFSAFARGFGDKELLFHFLLAPFAALPDAEQGGRLALALLDALILTALGLLARRALGPRGAPGRWAWLVPVALVLSVTEFSWRLVRLRPELLSLFLLLLALAAAARGRHRLAGVVALVYTLSYTACHALLGLFGAVFAFFAWGRRRLEPGLLLYPLLGVGLGLLLHPHFPKNLEIWALQNVAFFSLKDTLDVGTEIRPNFTSVVLLMPLGWYLGLAALWRSGVPREEDPGERDEARRFADVFGVAALLFGGLYLMMSRFSIYFFPLATLAVLFALKARGKGVGRWVALPWRGRVPLVAALGVALLVSVPEARRQLATFAQRTNPGPEKIRITDREAVSRVLPAGARVAAPWASTHLYLFYAPQAYYLNVLDPLFMAVPHPRAYALQRDLFAGSLPDAPPALATGLASDHLAFSTVGEGQKLLARLRDDPRLQPLHLGFNAVFRVLPDANGSFWRDWRVRPNSLGPPLPDTSSTAPGEGEASLPENAAESRQDRPDRVPLSRLGRGDRGEGNWPAYPLLPSDRGGRFEGYVDARRFDPEVMECRTFVRAERFEQPVTLDLELAPSGPATLWVDGREIVTLGGAPGAVLGRGARVPVALAAGEHRFTVTTCPEGGPGSRMGFFLVERERRPGRPE